MLRRPAAIAPRWKTRTDTPPLIRTSRKNIARNCTKRTSTGCPRARVGKYLGKKCRIGPPTLRPKAFDINSPVPCCKPSPYGRCGGGEQCHLPGCHDTITDCACQRLEQSCARLRCRRCPRRIHLGNDGRTLKLDLDPI